MLIKEIIKNYTYKTGKLKWLYVKICKPSALEYAVYLKKWGNYYAIGDDCSIPTFANVPDPEYTKLGNNVQLSACTILGHDGSICMLNRAYGKKLDRVGSVTINDNVFIGHGAIILPNITIGHNVIVAAGSLVSKDIQSGCIVAGIPAKIIGKTDDLVEKLENELKELPWKDIIYERNGSFDASLEPELKVLRQKYFFGEVKK
jgi:acetyltransferase-like isoleucine patch superfamily enzyme